MTRALEPNTVDALSVEIRGLDHGYDENLVLHDIELSIKAGSPVACLVRADAARRHCCV